jgi:uncharacterized RDD family membrane protein YckC
MKRYGSSPADSALPVQTPEGIEFVLYPAGLLIRACAWAIDCFFQGALLLVIVIAGSLTLGTWFFLILMFALDWFYHTAFDVFCRGQSPGKRIMGIRVVRGDGSPVNPGASFLRNLLRFADTFMFLYLIAFLCMAVSPGFRRFGDWVADTLVVYTANARLPARFSPPVLTRSGMPWLEDFPMVSPGKLSYEEKQAILMFARRYPLLGRARSDEIAGIWAAKLKAGLDGDSGLSDSAVESASKAEASASAYLLGIARTLGGGAVSDRLP